MINQLNSLLQQRAHKIEQTMRQNSDRIQTQKMHGSHIALHDCIHFLSTQQTVVVAPQQAYQFILKHIQKKHSQISSAQQDIKEESHQQIAKSILQELTTIHTITKHMMNQRSHDKLNSITNQKEREIREEITKKLQ